MVRPFIKRIIPKGDDVSREREHRVFKH